MGERGEGQDSTISLLPLRITPTTYQAPTMYVPGHSEALGIDYLFIYTTNWQTGHFYHSHLQKPRLREFKELALSHSKRRARPSSKASSSQSKQEKEAQRSRDDAHPVSINDLSSMCEGSSVGVQRGGQIPTCHPKLERPEKASWRSQPIHTQGCQSLKEGREWLTPPMMGVHLPGPGLGRKQHSPEEGQGGQKEPESLPALGQRPPPRLDASSHLGGQVSNRSASKSALVNP